MPAASIPFRALFFSAAGIASLCAMDAAAKVVTQAEGVLVATFLRFSVSSLILVPLVLVLRRPFPGRRGMKAHLGRGLLLVPTNLCFFYGISVLPLAEAITLAFVAPLIVPPLAALFLGEKMRMRALLAIVAGFAGVLVTVQGADGDAAAVDPRRPLAIAALLVSATCYALQSLILRHRAQRDDPLVVAALSVAVPLALIAPAVPLFAHVPHSASLPPGILSGIFGGLGILLLTRAYALAEAQFLIIFEYTGLFWAALFGWLVFSESPRAEIWIGAAIIIAACLVSALPDRRRKGVAAKESAF